jgi:hypothetical protein
MWLASNFAEPNSGKLQALTCGFTFRRTDFFRAPEGSWSRATLATGVKLSSRLLDPEDLRVARLEAGNTSIRSERRIVDRVLYCGEAEQGFAVEWPMMLRNCSSGHCRK